MFNLIIALFNLLNRVANINVKAHTESSFTTWRRSVIVELESIQAEFYMLKENYSKYWRMSNHMYQWVNEFYSLIQVAQDAHEDRYDNFIMECPVHKNPYRDCYTRGMARTTHHTRSSRDVRNGNSVKVVTQSAYGRSENYEHVLKDLRRGRPLITSGYRKPKAV